MSVVELNKSENNVCLKLFSGRIDTDVHTRSGTSQMIP